MLWIKKRKNIHVWKFLETFGWLAMCELINKSVDKIQMIYCIVYNNENRLSWPAGQQATQQWVRCPFFLSSRTHPIRNNMHKYKPHKKTKFIRNFYLLDVITNIQLNCIALRWELYYTALWWFACALITVHDLRFLYVVIKMNSFWLSKSY